MNNTDIIKSLTDIKAAVTTLIDAVGAPVTPPVTTPPPPLTTITAPAVGQTVSDAKGHVFSFGPLVAGSRDYVLLRDGKDIGRSTQLVLSAGTVWGNTATWGWFSFDQTTGAGTFQPRPPSEGGGTPPVITVPPVVIPPVVIPPVDPPVIIPPVTPGNGKLQVGLVQPVYYNQFSPFLNWWKQGNTIAVGQAGAPTLQDGITAHQKGFFDNNAELKLPCDPSITFISKGISAPAALSQVTAAGGSIAGEKFVVSWKTGAATVTLSGATVDATSPNSVKCTATGAEFYVQLNVTDHNNPPRGISVTQARYTSNVVAGEIFNPDFVTECKKYKILRFMDWQQTNNSDVQHFNQLADLKYDFWGQFFGLYYSPFSPINTSQYGPKASVHPEIICALAKATGCAVHVNIPFHADDDFVRQFSGYMAANCPTEVTYEYSNEVWNGGFQQFNDALSAGKTTFPNVDQWTACFQYYGYRAAQVMAIVKSVYEGLGIAKPGRWLGALATQTANAAIGVDNMVGANLAKAGTFNQLFDYLYVTGYFADVFSTYGAVEQCIPAGGTTFLYSEGGISDPTYGIKVGDYVRLFFSQASGFASYNNSRVKVTVIGNTSGANGYEVELDTTGKTHDLVIDHQSYMCRSLIFDMMDQSLIQHNGDAVRYPTKYQWFNEQLAQSIMTGTCSAGFKTDGSIASLKNNQWPAQLANAKAWGLKLRQYEGGNSFLGDAYLAGFGGNPQFTDFAYNFGYSKECADIYAAMYQAWAAFGDAPSKFQLDGPPSQFGMWGGIRFWPLAANGGKVDNTNPVMIAVETANAS